MSARIVEIESLREENAELRAALVAARAGCTVRIIDGRSADAVAAALGGEPVGTTVRAPQEVS